MVKLERTPPTTHFIFLFCLCNSGVLHLSFNPRFVCFLRFLCRRSRYLFPFLNCVALFSFNGHTIITPVLFLSIHHLSLRRLNPLLLCLYISLPPVVPLFLTHSYAIFCFAWRIHLACGCLGSDGYISWEGGCLVNRYLLVSTMGSVRADADFPQG